MAFPYSSGDVLTAADLNQSSGLVHVKTQTIGTGVSSVTVSNAFSSTFENYRITYTLGDASVSSAWVEFYFSGTTTAYYGYTRVLDYSTGESNVQRNNQPTALVGRTSTSIGFFAFHIDVYSPFASDFSSFASFGVGDAALVMSGHTHNVAQSHTGFVVKPSSGTLTAGSLKVYGYNNG